MTRPGRRPAALAVGLAAAAVLTLSGCSGSDDTAGGGASTTPAGTATSTPTVTPTGSPSGSPSDGPSATPSADGTTVDVTFSGDTVTPNGERLEVKAGEDVTLRVTADAAGEIHVHTTPEQELEYAVGNTTLTIKDLDQPGIVEVESHGLDKVILQLQVQ